MGENDITNIYDNLPDNSHKAKSERTASVNAPAPTGKRVEKVVRGNVKTKKNEIRKLTDIFISEDVHNVKEHIIFDVLAPAIKKAVYDVVVNSLDMTLFGGRGDGRKRSTADKVSYRDYSSMSNRDNHSYSRGSASVFDYDDIIFDRRADAVEVLQRLDEVMEEYDSVRVADLYDLVGISCPHTGNKYGWTNIRNAEVIQLRNGGYTIKMPRAVPIGRN